MKFARPDIQFQIEDDRPLTLRFSAKALAALQDEWQLTDLDEVNSRMILLEKGGLTAQDLGVILWAGFRTHHPDITMEQALEMLDDLGIANFQTLLVRAISAASQDAGQKKSLMERLGLGQ